MRYFIADPKVDDRLMRRIVMLLGDELEQENELFNKELFVERCFKTGVIP